MKSIILTCLVALSALYLNAQVVTDTVSVGASYANHVWYSLENDEVGSAPKNNWDIAFETTAGFGWSVHSNPEGGVMLYVVSTDTTEWATVDTTGIGSMDALYNSDTTWFVGAFDAIADPNDDFDLGWGAYNLGNHHVIGNKIYIIKLTDGTYQKIWIKRLAGGAFTFRHANIDGTGDMTHTITKADYSTKNLVYYSLSSHTVVDREPASDDWQLVFGQYYALVSDGQGGFVPYSVTGVRSNATVSVAVAENLADAENFTDYESLTFGGNITTIGHYWKNINMTTFQWEITDSLAYFVSSQDGDIWKLIFTGFSGSSTGSYIFSKEKLLEADTVGQVGIFEAEQLAATMVVYPNPSNGQDVTVVYNIMKGGDVATLQVFDLTGRQVLNAPLDGSTGLKQYQIPVSQLDSGMYIVTLTLNGQQTQQKLIVK